MLGVRQEKNPNHNHTEVNTVISDSKRIKFGWQNYYWLPIHPLGTPGDGELQKNPLPRSKS